MNFKTINYQCANGVSHIILNRPDRLNAMNVTLIDETAKAFRYANADSSSNVILFYGAGNAFCAGDDRKEHTQHNNEKQAREFVESIQQVTREIIYGKKIVVGAIHGWAAGGGFEWAINCDFTFWSETAQAFFPEVSLNLFVTGGVTSLLPAIVGLSKAREMLILGEKYSAADLQTMGLAYKVTKDEQLMDRAEEFSLRLARLSTTSSQAMKRAINKGALHDLEKSLEQETIDTTECFLDPETTKRLKDF